MDALQLFRAYIKEKGMRYTPGRETIVAEIFSRRDHFDVEGLFLQLRKKKKRISRASIYRAIPLLIECGLIKEIFYDNGHLHYEPVYGYEQHCHLRCTRCGKVVDFSDEQVNDIQQRIKKRYDFVINALRFELLGHCPRCAQMMKNQRDRRKVR